MGEARKSLVTPLFLSCIIVPHAHRGTVMHEVAITPESIQLSEKARTAPSAETPNSSSAAVMTSACNLPMNSTYSASTMRGASSEKNMLALSFTNTLRLRSVSCISARNTFTFHLRHVCP